MQNFEALESRMLLSSSITPALQLDTGIDAPISITLMTPEQVRQSQLHGPGFPEEYIVTESNTLDQSEIYSELIGEEEPPYDPEYGLWNKPEQFLRVITWSYDQQIHVQEYTKGESGEFDQLRSQGKYPADRVVLILKDGVQPSDVEQLIASIGGTILTTRPNARFITVQIEGDLALDKAFKMMGQLSEYARDYFEVINLHIAWGMPSPALGSGTLLVEAESSIEQSDNSTDSPMVALAVSSLAQTSIDRFALLHSNVFRNANFLTLTQVNFDLSDDTAQKRELGLG